MGLKIYLTEFKKVKKIIEKSLTVTQLKDKELFISKEMGFIKLYVYDNEAEIGIYIDCKDSVNDDYIYKCLYSEFNNAITEMKGNKNTIIELNVDTDDNISVKYADDKIILINRIGTKNKDFEVLNDSILINALDIKNSLEFLKPILEKSDIEVFNYTNFNLDDELIISLGNIVSVGNANIELNNFTHLKWNFSILNENVSLLLKWLQINFKSTLNTYLSNKDKVVFSSENSYIKIPYRNGINNKFLTKLTYINGEEKDVLNLIKLKADLSCILLPYKGSFSKFKDKCIPLNIEVGDITVKVDAYLLNKIIEKNDKLKIYLFNKRDNSPLVIMDEISNSKILFNVLKKANTIIN